MGLGYVEGVTHDDIRQGITTLFAALDMATGEVLPQCGPRHRHQEFLGFLRQIETSVPEDLDVHLIVDNYCTQQFVAAYNETKAPCNWTSTADSILVKLQRLCSQISGTGHQETAVNPIQPLENGTQLH